MNYEEIVNEARAALAEAGIDDNTPVAGGIRQLIKRGSDARAELEAARTAVPESVEGDNLAARVARLATDLTRLRPLADDGRAYRTDLIDEALAEGVRAHGEKFAAETYRGLLEASNLEAIKRMRDDWASIAAQRFSGGRQSRDAEEADTAAANQPVKKDGRGIELPAAAHKA